MLAAALVLAVLAVGLLALILLRISGTKTQQRGFYHMEQTADGSLLVYDDVSARPDACGVIRDHETGKWWLCENGRVLYDAMSVLQEITTPGMTQEEKLRVCFDFVKGHSEGMSRSPHLLCIDWPEVYAADLFEGDGGNCCSFAAAFAYLARTAGYTEVYACKSGGHGWAEVDGFIYDPERAANSYLTPCYGFDYQYAEDYRQAMETYASDPAEYDWMHIKIFDENREET